MTSDTVPSLPFSSAPPRPAQAALKGAALALAGAKSRLWVPRVAGGARSAQISTVAPGKAALTLPEPGVWCEMMAENRCRPQQPHGHWHQHWHQHRALRRGATQPISQLLELEGSVSLVQPSHTSTDTHLHTRQTRWCPPGSRHSCPCQAGAAEALAPTPSSALEQEVSPSCSAPAPSSCSAGDTTGEETQAGTGGFLHPTSVGHCTEGAL